MRAMAILYLGLADPDFERDYYISPILAPSSLLAQFPSILMTCGEKDPFVDDTVIFAGRVREAKRALRATLQMEAAGKSAKFGEGLRMSIAAGDGPRAHLLQESEEDWVQMELFEGWSHGYLLMPALMSEAREAIIRIGEWIDGAFVRYGRRLPPTPPPRDSRVKSPVRQTLSPRSASSVRRGGSSWKAQADLGGVVLSSETDTEAEGLVMPSRRRRSPPPSFGSTSTVRPVDSPASGSGETLVTVTAPITKVSAKGLDEAELIRRRRAEAAI
jgi:alpha/beta hydrolase fold